MSRFPNAALVTDELTVMTQTEDEEWSETYVERAGAIVEMAIQSCLNAKRLLDVAPGRCDDETADALRTYFCLDARDRSDARLATHLNKIRATLIKTAAGLGGAVLKIGDNVEKAQQPVNGAVSSIVNQQWSAYGQFPDDWQQRNRIGNDPTGVAYKKPFYNAVIWQDDGRTDAGTLVVMRAIRLEARHLFNKEVVKTLIHEATHKYDGTVDMFLFKPDGKTLRESATSPGAEDALKNADSYGWFAYVLGKTARHG